MGKLAVHVPLVVVEFTRQLMPLGVLVITPPPLEPAPGAIVRRCGAAVNAAATAVVALLCTVMAQVAPVHAPANPSKLELLVPAPVRVTVLPASNVALQVPLATPALTVQERPDGELVTTPLPVPLPVNEIVPGVGTRYVTSAVRDCTIVT
jgi:hypothetical protein